MGITESDFEKAQGRSEALRKNGYATAARYDAPTRSIVVDLNTGVRLSFPATRTEGPSEATDEDLASIEISPSGLGLYWPSLDADVYLPGIMRGIFGSKKWMAAELGALGGSVKSATKAAAARANGLKGGRPRLGRNAADGAVNRRPRDGKDLRKIAD